MDRSYAEAYPELYRNHWWWRARERILLREIGALLGAQRKTARILDIGCGAGLFFDALQQFGSVEGLESDATAIALSGAWRNNIHQGYLDDSFQPEHPYDLVLLLDVLEHVDAPNDLLRRAGQLLAPTGRVLVTVPAFGWLWTRHDDINHHLRRYTRRGLADTLREAGLREVRNRFLFQSLVLPKLLVRAMERVAVSRSAIPHIPARPVNSLVSAWYDFEFRVAGRIPVGSSILMVGKPRADDD